MATKFLAHKCELNFATSLTVIGADENSPIDVTVNSHGLTTGQTVRILGVAGQTGANGTFKINVQDSNTLELIGSTSVGVFSGSGSTIHVGIGSVTNISGPGYSADMVEFTSFDSTDQAKEFQAGFFDGGEVTLECFLDTTDIYHILLRTNLTGQSVDAYQFVANGASSRIFAFNAHVSAYAPNAGGLAEGMMLSITLKITGNPVIT